MLDRLQISGARLGADRTLEVEGDVCHLRVQAGGDVDLHADEQDAVLRFVRIAGGYRAEPIDAGELILVNGEELYCKDLVTGDVVLVDDLRLRWLAATGPKVGSSLAGRTARRSSSTNQRTRAAGDGAKVAKAGPAHRRKSSSGMPAAVPILLAIVSVGAVLVLLEFLGDTGDSWTPQERLQLARQQLANGSVGKAQATLDIVIGEATGRVRSDAEQLRQQIVKASAERANRQAVADGEPGVESLDRFVDRYLMKGGGRPEARVFVRLCDYWLADHAGPCGKSAAGRLLVDRVRTLRQTYYGPSELPAPDEAEDVIFAARARLRFMVRDYQEAMRLLDAFGAGAPADEVEKIEQARQEMLAAGEVWLQDRLAMVERMINRNDLVRAQSEMRALDRRSILPAWEELAEPVRVRLQ